MLHQLVQAPGEARSDLWQLAAFAKHFTTDEDARKRGINQGAEVPIISRRGEIRSRIETAGRNRMPSGVVFVRGSTPAN
jgi:nitrate reductase NapA